MKVTRLALAGLMLLGCMDSGAYYESYREPPPPLENEGDRYEAVGTNPYVDAAHDPFSTFAADVDTASYDIFVRDATAGTLPLAESVRLEEYVNSFDYDYPAPELDAEVPFDIALAAAAHPFRPGITQIRVGIQAAVPAEHEQLPTNLVFLVDTSGSMSSSQKLPLVKRLMHGALDQLGAYDTVSIVTYAGSTRVALPPTRIQDRAAIERVIDDFSAGGSTAGASGIELAYQQAEAAFIEGGFNHVVLMTDGDFNVGPSSDTELVALIEEKRLSGVTLTALGFGSGNLNDSMMERVSNAGNGIYSVITSEAHADRYAEGDLLRAAHFVAQDMKIQVEFNAEHVLAYRLLGYENRAIADEDFREDEVDAGEVGAGHRVTALYEVVLAGQSIPSVAGAPELDNGDPVEGDRAIDAANLITVRVRYKELGATALDPASEVAESLSSAQVFAALDSPPDRDLLYASAVAALAEIVKRSPYAMPDQLDNIGAVLLEQADRDRGRAELAELFTTIRARLAAR